MSPWGTLCLSQSSVKEREPMVAMDDELVRTSLGSSWQCWVRLEVLVFKDWALGGL